MILNFLEETKEEIERNNKSHKDIVFIGSSDFKYSCTWGEFLILASFYYDCGFGCAEVKTDLIIVFSDGARMFRQEYDGSEWWEYQSSFNPPDKTKRIKTLKIHDYGYTISDDT